MSKEKSESKESNLLPKLTTIRRWLPNHHYLESKFINVPLSGFKSTEKSLTDKEAYRVTLSSLRGTLSAQGLGSPTVGSYSIKAGEKYDSNFDFSYLNRPDVTLVELHEFIEDMKENLENYDNDIQIKLKEELAQAEIKAKELEKDELAKAPNSSSKAD